MSSDLKLFQAVRDLLLPGVRIFNSNYPDLEFDLEIQCDKDDGEPLGLIVKGYDPKKHVALGFAITREQIRDNVYKTQFAPSMKALALMLTQALPASGSEAALNG